MRKKASLRLTLGVVLTGVLLAQAPISAQTTSNATGEWADRAGVTVVMDTLSGAAIKASLPKEEIQVGEVIQLKTKMKGLTLKSSNTQVVSVNQNGTMIGKKAGTAKITVKKKGCKSVVLTLKVVKRKYKPTILVTPDEVVLKNTKLEQGVYSFQLKNNAKSKAKWIELQFSAKLAKYETTTNELGESVQTEVTYSEKLSVTKKNVNAGQLTETITLPVPENTSVKQAALTKVKVYAGSAVMTYNVKKGTYAYAWGTEDKKAPKITGMVGENSYNGKDICITLYKDQTFPFEDYIQAEDNRDGKVKITVDTSKVNYKKKGTYTVTVTATDKAGNTAKEKVKVKVRLADDDVDWMADIVLADIIKDNWSQEKKVRAIYSYVKSNLSYVSHSKYKDWEKEAAYGFRYGYGDCLTYYAMTRILLTRAGIPNIMVQRNTTNPTHYWNMAYLSGKGWYHVDACMRQVRCTLCLLTDAQLTDFSNYYKTVAGFYSNTWDRDKYPKSATKILTKTYR